LLPLRQLLLLSMRMQVDEEFLESIKKDDLLSAMLSEMGEEYPEVLRALLHDRNWYLAIQIWRAAQTSHKPLVAVLGKGHLQGVVYVLCYLSIIAARVAMESQAQRGGNGGRVE
jgi:pheromone shutdown protein TraB